ncbi:MAG: hypothetical protein PF570_03465, partial [Candidatus Cloacimonetes bacterium]|nr:hypothetical protein [Candidatus Cloacimonadota bacterium]
MGKSINITKKNVFLFGTTCLLIATIISTIIVRYYDIKILQIDKLMESKVSAYDKSKILYRKSDFLRTMYRLDILELSLFSEFILSSEATKLTKDQFNKKIDDYRRRSY